MTAAPEMDSLLGQIKEFVRAEVARQLSLLSSATPPPSPLPANLRQVIQEQVCAAHPCARETRLVPTPVALPEVAAPLSYAEGLARPPPVTVAASPSVVPLRPAPRFVQPRIVAKDNLAYACKIVNMGETSREYRTRFLPREINILARLRHPNIARVFQIICEARKVFFIMELATAGDLLFKIQNAGRLHERTAHHIFVQLASAVAYLHRHNIAHRDLKCENVLLTTQLVVKLADFSFSRYCTTAAHKKKVYSETYCGSEAYAPPEVLQGIPYQPKKADMWSLGVVLYVMMTAALPFEDGNIVRQVRLQMNRVIRFPRYLDSTHEYRNLVRVLLEPVTTLRATMGMVVKHPWLLLYPDPTNT
ncbi:testis-specific serine/threonine-protein kinase 6-like [Dermacentor andersoni]|uniref:testis-specific serine/threonine-protein kinase 6-like n=1 Tax=Dermacentor andersoni TaxID=34620 RepID=UPI003B3A488F